MEEANARDLRRGVKLTYVLLAAAYLAGLAGAAGLPGAPHQPAHPGADRRARQTGGGRPQRARADAPRRRNRPRHPGVQPHGRPAAGEHRAAGLPDAAGQLADAGAQDGARGEELADADPADRGRDAGAHDEARPRLHGAGRADRGGRDGDAWSGASARSRSSPPSRRCSPRRSTSTRCCRSASRSSKRRIPEVTYDCRLARRAPPVRAPTRTWCKGILTNLLENAAEAAGEGGAILGVTAADDGTVAIEVHDSGPGLSEQARESSSSRPFRSRSAAWDWACRSRARARCCPAATSCW